MYETSLNNVKKGSYFFKRHDLDSTLFVRDHFDRASKKYSYHAIDDYNKEFFAKGSTLVYCDFDDLINKRSSCYIDIDSRRYKVYAAGKGRRSGYIFEPFVEF